MQTTRHFNWPCFAQRALTLCLVVCSGAALASEPTDAAKCMSIPVDRDRLDCYDALNRQPGTPPAASEPLQQLSTRKAPITDVTTAPPTPLAARWELDPGSKQGLWVIRPYEPMFILPIVYTNNVNTMPQSPTHPPPPAEPLQNTEAEFQISLKAKAAENLFGYGVDLWFAYTQQSQWQVYNSAHSSPFRETNYSPEMFLVLPTRYELFGLTGRFIRVGLVHQSNGRDDPLSRSWNRVYAQFGFERGNFSLLVRPWARIKENPSEDDNPDITHYLGYGDITAIYQMANSEFTVVGRYNAGNLSTIDTLNFPIHGRLKAYVKITTGYGETLIDYNWHQNTIGLGILLVDWQ
jgi:phospholipase A1